MTGYGDYDGSDDVQAPARSEEWSIWTHMNKLMPLLLIGNIIWCSYLGIKRDIRADDQQRQIDEIKAKQVGQAQHP